MLNKPLFVKLFEIFRFGIVGLMATGVHLGVALMLVKITDLPLLLINICAFCVAFVFSYGGHFYFTFKRTSGHKSSFVKHFCVSLSGLGVSSLLLATMIYFGIGGDIAKLVVSILMIPVFTYLLSKRWSFAQQ